MESAMSSNRKRRRRSQTEQDSATESSSPPPSTTDDDSDEPEQEIRRSFRVEPPAHFCFTIENFAFLSSMEFENYESGVFTAHNYKWKLSLYPNGNTKGDGEGHVSLYLVLADTKDLPHFGIRVIFRLFVYDYKRSQYLTVQDGKERCFSTTSTEWGFDQLITKEEINDPSSGYLFDYGSCEFGAEVFVIKRHREEHLDMVKNPRNGFFIWNIVNFSARSKEYLTLISDKFVVNGQEWKLLMHPNGHDQAKGLSLSLFLFCADYCTYPYSRHVPPETKTYAKYKLRIRDQAHDNHHEIEDYGVFSAQSKAQGHDNFLMLEDLKDPTKGFIVNDTVVVEAKILALSDFKVF